MNKIYHLNVGFGNTKDEKEKNCGHICHPHFNEWRSTGKVRDIPYYNVREAIYDLYDFFYKQNVECEHYIEMTKLYVDDRQKFDEEVKKYVKKYATEPTTHFKKRNKLFFQ